MDHHVAIIDFRECKYLGQLHERIKNALDFPEHYGGNWDAFGDCLRFDTPVDHIQIVGEHTLPPELREHTRIMCELLEQCKEERAVEGYVFHYEIID